MGERWALALSVLSLRTFDRNIVHSGGAIAIVLVPGVAVLVPQSHLFLIGAGGCSGVS